MSIGKTVYGISDVNRISFGTVLAEKVSKGWMWYRISWSNMPPSNPYNNKNLDLAKGWFRSDTVRFFNIDSMVSELSELR